MDAYKQLEWNLTNRTPPAAGIAQIEELRKLAKHYGRSILDLCPESRERSLALTKLEETTMWAVAAIARQTG